MPKAKDENLSKHTLNLYEGDYLAIQSAYPDVGAAVIIRRVVRTFVQSLESGSSSSAHVEVQL